MATLRPIAKKQAIEIGKSQGVGRDFWRKSFRHNKRKPMRTMTAGSIHRLKWVCGSA
jgi:hypothetical protein